jgi:hypothetical protein
MLSSVLRSPRAVRVNDEGAGRIEMMIGSRLRLRQVAPRRNPAGVERSTYPARLARNTPMHLAPLCGTNTAAHAHRASSPRRDFRDR